MLRTEMRCSSPCLTNICITSLTAYSSTKYIMFTFSQKNKFNTKWRTKSNASHTFNQMIMNTNHGQSKGKKKWSATFSICGYARISCWDMQLQRKYVQNLPINQQKNLFKCYMNVKALSIYRLFCWKQEHYSPYHSVTDHRSPTYVRNDVNDKC